MTRDGTVESVSQDQIPRRGRGKGNMPFPCSVDHEKSRIGKLYPVDQHSANTPSPEGRSRVLKRFKRRIINQRSMRGRQIGHRETSGDESTRRYYNQGTRQETEHGGATPYL